MGALARARATAKKTQPAPPEALASPGFDAGLALRALPESVQIATGARGTVDRLRSRGMAAPGDTGPIGPYPGHVADTDEGRAEYDRLRRRVLWTMPGKSSGLL